MAKIIDNYILLEHICQGTFGEIHKGRNLISKEAVAVKTVQLEQFLNDSVLRDMIINEIQALKKLEDPNIVRMIKMLKSSNNIYLIYEFLQGRNLKKLLSERHHLTELEAIQIFQQVCKGFQRLQAEKIVKKNLNSHNIHVIEQQSDLTNQLYEVKLKHFFICKSSSSNSSSSRKFEQFLYEKFHYVAPELLINQQQNGGTKQIQQNQQQESGLCDVFSAGVVLYEMLIGTLPFEKYANTKEDLLEFYSNNDIQDVIAQDISHLSERTQHLLNKMLVVEQDDRITWEEIFQIVGQFEGATGNTNINLNAQHPRVIESSPHHQGASPRKHQSMNNAQLTSLQNNISNPFRSDQDEGDQNQYKQGKLSAQKNQKSNSNNNDSSEDETADDDSKTASNTFMNQKSNKKSKSNVNINNNSLNQISTGTINLNNNNNNTSTSKQKIRNHSEMTQQMTLQDGLNSPPVATVNLTQNKSQQNIIANSNNQKELNMNSASPFYASVNSKINKENSSIKMNEFSSSMIQNNKRENSIDPSTINTRQSQQNNNFVGNSNTNNSGSKVNKEAINQILEEIMDKRSKIQVILGALDNCMDQDEWNVTTLNVYSCGFILLKKACGLSEYLMQIFENPEKVLAHLKLTASQFQAWQLCSKKQQIKLNIMRENLELKNNLMKFQDDFSENIQIFVNNVNIYNNKRGGDEIDNDESLNTLLFDSSKEMSLISAQTKNRKSLVLAHYLADIACIDIMYNKFLGKKRLDVLNHPYFKKLSEISREKLQENLDNKFKLYEYHRTCSDV